MSLDNAERRPGTNGAALDVMAGDLDVTSVSPGTDALCHPRAVAPAYVILVTTTEGRTRRRVYMSLHSALKAKERTEAKGHHFDMVLAELVPVPHQPFVVVGGDAE